MSMPSPCTVTRLPLSTCLRPMRSGIMGDTQYTLEHSARIKTKKRSDLYQEWDKDVFGKIQVCAELLA